MESFTLFLFVLGLLVAAFIVTQIIRRELKDREQLESDTRRETLHARPEASARAPRMMRGQPMRQRAHKSPPNML
jgi:hypothetical protein